MSKVEKTEESYPRSGRILVVDDEPMSRMYMAACLRKGGLECVLARNVTEAKERLKDWSFQAFDCLVTDYSMKGENGADLLRWLQGEDNTLASVVITADGEKDIVETTLRNGASDYLEKPVKPEAFITVVRKLCETTAKRRSMRESYRAVRDLRDLQAMLCRVKLKEGIRAPDYVCLPKHELGGDFFEIFPLDEDRMMVVCADVSGHDLKAAYVSFYFKGVVRGLLSNNYPIPKIVEYFNQLLLDEWNNDPAYSEKGEVAFSLAAVFAEINLKEARIEVYNCGLPQPFFADREGRIAFLDDYAQPLGWFKDGYFPREVYDCTRHPYAYIYTDGLSDYATKLGVSECSFTYRVLREKDPMELARMAADAPDDLMLLRVPLSGGLDEPEPVLFAKHFIDEVERIDTCQEYWERSLRFALDNAVGDELLKDVLLCCREMMLNGLKYGCAARPQEPCVLQISYKPVSKILTVRVDDPGDGYEKIDPNEELKKLEERLDGDLDEEGHLSFGLALLKGLSDEVVFKRNGASVIAVFSEKIRKEV